MLFLPRNFAVICQAWRREAVACACFTAQRRCVDRRTGFRSAAMNLEMDSCHSVITRWIVYFCSVPSTADCVSSFCFLGVPGNAYLRGSLDRLLLWRGQDSAIHVRFLCLSTEATTSSNRRLWYENTTCVLFPPCILGLV